MTEPASVEPAHAAQHRHLPILSDNQASVVFNGIDRLFPFCQDSIYACILDFRIFIVHLDVEILYEI